MQHGRALLPVLYEPFGAQVIDGLIYVTCRNGIVRLHDLNNDGEADFYETWYADTDVSTFFHSFNFDLQVDHRGHLYYVKAGEYTDYKLPGAVIEDHARWQQGSGLLHRAFESRTAWASCPMIA